MLKTFHSFPPSKSYRCESSQTTPRKTLNTSHRRLLQLVQRRFRWTGYFPQKVNIHDINRLNCGRSTHMVYFSPSYWRDELLSKEKKKKLKRVKKKRRSTIDQDQTANTLDQSASVPVIEVGEYKSHTV